MDEFIDPYTALMMARQRDPYMNFLPNQQYVQEGFYQPVANGGRIGYANGEMVEGGTVLSYTTAGTVSDGVVFGISYLNILKEKID